MSEDSQVLEALVLEEDLDALFELASLDDIAAAWCRYNSVPHPSDEDDPDWWAVDLFFTTEVFRRRDVYRSLLLRLVDHPDETVLGKIDAGPLENFVSDDADDLHWLESQCATNPKLRTALAGVSVLQRPERGHAGATRQSGGNADSQAGPARGTDRRPRTIGSAYLQSAPPARVEDQTLRRRSRHHRRRDGQGVTTRG